MNPARDRLRRVRLAAPLLGLALLAAGCSGDDDNGGGVAVDDDELPLALTGALAGPGGETGTIDVTVVEPAGGGDQLEVRGTVVTGAGSIPVSGTLNRVNGSIQFVGGGYDFRCHYVEGRVHGAYDGPAGTGGWAMLSESSRQVSLQCGTFGGTDSGTMNLVTGSDGVVLAPYCANDGTPRGVLEGSNGQGSVQMDDDQRSADGTSAGTSASGTWNGGGGSGTWSADASTCP